VAEHGLVHKELREVLGSPRFRFCLKRSGAFALVAGEHGRNAAVPDVERLPRLTIAPANAGEPAGAACACRDQATSKLMELSARLGNPRPYRKAHGGAGRSTGREGAWSRIVRFAGMFGPTPPLL